MTVSLIVILNERLVAAPVLFVDSQCDRAIDQLSCIKRTAKDIEESRGEYLFGVKYDLCCRYFFRHSYWLEND